MLTYILWYFFIGSAVALFQCYIIPDEILEKVNISRFESSLIDFLLWPLIIIIIIISLLIRLIKS